MNPPRSLRAGGYGLQPGGYETFRPKPLPPDPPLSLEGELLSLLSRAELALGRLDGASLLLPDPDLFVFMYVRREAVFSCMIEGTRASLLDLLEYEAQAIRGTAAPDVEEVSNYVAAMNYGLHQIGRGRRLSLDLWREIHARLMEGVRGGEFRPGELRAVQNWIGPPGVGLRGASFVPPAPEEVEPALTDLEDFLVADSTYPALLKAGLAHAQFESIHPFLDGNGRVGRLLISFLLTVEGVIERPLLYLSYFFHQHRPTYYQLLQAVRDEGDWEGWLAFFLRGVEAVAQQATQTSKDILVLREAHRKLIMDELGATAPKALDLLERLFQQPILSIKAVGRITGLAAPAATRLVHKLEELALLVETTGKARYRRYAYQPYLELLED